MLLETRPHTKRKKADTNAHLVKCTAKRKARKTDSLCVFDVMVIATVAAVAMAP